MRMLSEHEPQTNGITGLQRLWQEARADQSPGLDPDEIFNQLERKYQEQEKADLPTR